MLVYIRRDWQWMRFQCNSFCTDLLGLSVKLWFTRPSRKRFADVSLEILEISFSFFL